ncbi:MULTISPECIES: hypothetical protein [Pseudomonadaceae]|uniref:hypothetical protein n=1 Tax=Pseudomonadaceae TaxID=135621 RepID=UPI00244CB302|nr:MULTISPECIES: hypothetical protein [Pseudomonas]MDH0335143.1 hypothetical protein [Pseudomonas otitidis]MDU9398084.1 hypothetical protein [Pseudomonas sp. zfem003]
MKFTTIPRIKRISLRRPALRRRRLYARKALFEMKGGPIDKAWLVCPGTLAFSVGQWRGYYDGENKWVDL